LHLFFLHHPQQLSKGYIHTFTILLSNIDRDLMQDGLYLTSDHDVVVLLQDGVEVTRFEQFCPWAMKQRIEVFSSDLPSEPLSPLLQHTYYISHSLRGENKTNFFLFISVIVLFPIFWWRVCVIAVHNNISNNNYRCQLR
jgi:hypothetical protein